MKSYKTLILSCSVLICFSSNALAVVANLAAPSAQNLQQSALNEQMHTLQQQNQQNQINTNMFSKPVPGLPQMQQQNQNLMNEAIAQTQQQQMSAAAMPSLELPVQQEQSFLSNPALNHLP